MSMSLEIWRPRNQEFYARSLGTGTVYLTINYRDNDSSPENSVTIYFENEAELEAFKKGINSCEIET